MHNALVLLIHTLVDLINNAKRRLGKALQRNQIENRRNWSFSSWLPLVIQHLHLSVVSKTNHNIDGPVLKTLVGISEADFTFTADKFEGVGKLLWHTSNNVSQFWLPTFPNSLDFFCKATIGASFNTNLFHQLGDRISSFIIARNQSVFANIVEKFKLGIDSSKLHIRSFTSKLQVIINILNLVQLLGSKRFLCLLKTRSQNFEFLFDITQVSGQILKVFFNDRNILLTKFLITLRIVFKLKTLKQLDLLAMLKFNRLA